MSCCLLFFLCFFPIPFNIFSEFFGHWHQLLCNQTRQLKIACALCAPPQVTARGLMQKPARNGCALCLDQRPRQFLAMCPPPRGGRGSSTPVGRGFSYCKRIPKNARHGCFQPGRGLETFSNMSAANPLWLHTKRGFSGFGGPSKPARKARHQ